MSRPSSGKEQGKQMIGNWEGFPKRRETKGPRVRQEKERAFTFLVRRGRKKSLPPIFAPAPTRATPAHDLVWSPNDLRRGNEMVGGNGTKALGQRCKRTFSYGVQGTHTVYVRGGGAVAECACSIPHSLNHT